MMRIYLAGGMHCDWRTQFKLAAPEHTWLDPMYTGFVNPTEAEYTKWDLDAIDSSDLVLVYMDADNPSGYGLSFEAGYAYAKNIPVWFIDQSPKSLRTKFGMVRATATRLFADVAEAITQLTSGD